MNEEIWKKVTNFPKYEVSSFGNIRNIITQNILKPSIKHNYKYVSLSYDDKSKMVSVHRIVAIEFIPNSENKPTVNHKDHNPSNNNVTNLEWATYLEQIIHKRKPSLEIYEYTGTRIV